MSKKASAFGVFVRTISADQPVNGARSKAQYLRELQEEYPFSQGWEVIGTHYVGTAPEGISTMIFLQKYVDSDYSQTHKEKETAEEESE